MKALVVSDKSTDDVVLMMSFYWNFKADKVLTVQHYHEVPTDARNEDGGLIHIQQPPIPLEQLHPREIYLEMLSQPPYNLPTDWVLSFNYALATTVDSTNTRRYQILQN